MNSNLLINTEKRSGDPELDSYIELLESVVLAYTSDNSTRLLGELNRIIGILADDANKIAEDGQIRGTKLIKEEKNNMMLDRIVKLLDQADKITSVGRKAVAIGSVKKPVEQSPVIPDEQLTEEEEKPIDDEDSLFNKGIPAIEALIKQAKENKR